MWSSADRMSMRLRKQTGGDWTGHYYSSLKFVTEDSGAQTVLLGYCRPCFGLRRVAIQSCETPGARWLARSSCLYECNEIGDALRIGNTIGKFCAGVRLTTLNFGVLAAIWQSEQLTSNIRKCPAAAAAWYEGSCRTAQPHRCGALTSS